MIKYKSIDVKYIRLINSKLFVINFYNLYYLLCLDIDNENIK